MDANPETTNWDDYSIGMERTRVEYDIASGLTNAAIDNPDTTKLMEDYIDALEQELRQYESYNGDRYTLDYNVIVCRKQRHDALLPLAEKLGIEFSGKYKTEHWDKLVKTDEFDNLKPGAKTVDKAFTLVEGKIDADASGKRCRFKVKNNTDYTYPEFLIAYRTKDKDGTVLDSELYSSARHFEGQSTVWTTGENIIGDDCQNIEAFGFAAGHHEFEVYGTEDLEIPLVLPVGSEETGEPENASTSSDAEPEKPDSKTPSNSSAANSGDSSNAPTTSETYTVAEYCDKMQGLYNRLTDAMDATHDAEAAGNVEAAKSAKKESDDAYGEVLRSTAPAEAKDVDMRMRQTAASMNLLAAFYEDAAIAKAEGDIARYKDDMEEIKDVISEVDSDARNLSSALKELKEKYQ